MIWFIERFVLPNYFDGVQSFGDLFARLVPCDAIGDVAANAVGDIFGLAVDDIVEDACRAAVRSAGDRLARDFIDNLSVDKLGMSGVCDVRDNDNNQFYDRRMVSGEVSSTNQVNAWADPNPSFICVNSVVTSLEG